MVDATLNTGDLGGGSSAGERMIGFWGRRGNLLGILVVNTLLGVLTFGIYRFWARTRLRQFFWNSLEIDGDILEYTGRGLELFIGFLIVVAVLVPLLIAYNFLSIFLQTQAPDLFTLANFLYFVILLWLIRYAYFRARRYRLARTVWRGIRCGQDGSAAVYAFLWFGYAVFSILTLGWAIPWMTAALQQYEVENARFGVENFRYNGNGKDLLKRWLPCGVLWTLALGVLVVGIIANFGEIREFVSSATDISPGADELGDGLENPFDALFGIAFFIYLISVPFYIYFRISALRYMISSSSLSDVKFTSELSGWRLVGYGALYGVVYFGSLIVAFAIAAGAIGGIAVLAESGGVPDDQLFGFGFIFAFIPVLIIFLLAPMLSMLLFYFPAIRHIATTLRLTNIASLERIVQSSKDDPRFGEGLAAALDVDVGGF